MRPTSRGERILNAVERLSNLNRFGWNIGAASGLGKRDKGSFKPFGDVWGITGCANKLALAHCDFLGPPTKAEYSL